MKKINIAAMALASLALLATSCSSEQDVADSSVAKGKMTFKATQETPGVTSRTTLDSDGLTINWQNDDDVDVFDDKSGTSTTYTATVDENNPTSANLEGTFTEESSKFLAIYPSDASSASYDEDNNKFTGISITIPSLQSPSKGTFDPDAAFMVATATIDNPVFSFKNACAFLKLTTAKEYSEIKITASDDYLSGTFGVTLDDDDNPTLGNTSKDNDNDKTITFNNLEAGTYYICVAPTTYSGGSTFTVECTNSDGTKDTYTTSGTYTLTRNTVYDMGTIKIPSVSCSRGTLNYFNVEPDFINKQGTYKPLLLDVVALTYTNVPEGTAITFSNSSSLLKAYSDEQCTTVISEMPTPGADGKTTIYVRATKYEADYTSDAILVGSTKHSFTITNYEAKFLNGGVITDPIFELTENTTETFNFTDAGALTAPSGAISVVYNTNHEVTVTPTSTAGVYTIKTVASPDADVIYEIKYKNADGVPITIGVGLVKKG